MTRCKHVYQWSQTYHHSCSNKTTKIMPNINLEVIKLVLQFCGYWKSFPKTSRPNSIVTTARGYEPRASNNIIRPSCTILSHSFPPVPPPPPPSNMFSIHCGHTQSTECSYRGYKNQVWRTFQLFFCLLILGLPPSEWPVDGPIPCFNIFDLL